MWNINSMRSSIYRRQKHSLTQRTKPIWLFCKDSTNAMQLAKLPPQKIRNSFSLLVAGVSFFWRHSHDQKFRVGNPFPSFVIQFIIAKNPEENVTQWLDLYFQYVYGHLVNNLPIKKCHLNIRIMLVDRYTCTYNDSHTDRHILVELLVICDMDWARG